MRFSKVYVIHFFSKVPMMWKEHYWWNVIAIYNATYIIFKVHICAGGSIQI